MWEIHIQVSSGPVYNQPVMAINKEYYTSRRQGRKVPDLRAVKNYTLWALWACNERGTFVPKGEIIWASENGHL